MNEQIDNFLRVNRNIGIVGDGQLGRMMIEAVHPDDREYIAVLGTAGYNSPSAQVGAIQRIGNLQDESAIRRLVEESDVTTWEIEHINAKALQVMADKGAVVEPSPASLRTIQNKYHQHMHFEDLDIATAPYGPFTGWSSLRTFREQYGDKVVIKQSQGGYDGRGN